MIDLFHTVSEKCSRIVTEKYSTSFASAIRLLHKDLRAPVFNIYGFVRFADEIVDTFHDYDKARLLEDFKKEAYEAIDRRISCNPILNSFQRTVNKYNISRELIEAFFHSMKMDLSRQTYERDDEFREYVYGSAEVVGLMCLCVFCEGRKDLYDQLKTSSQSLGAAFQKVNFLRDIKSDYFSLSRMYFPHCDFNNFTPDHKKQIETDIQKDFHNAYKGILKLPMKARFGVYVAYKYYLFLEQRIRISNYTKLIIILRAGVKNQLHLI
jgi:phytoene synthase